jgi:2'-5' RNA ligase
VLSDSLSAAMRAADFSPDIKPFRPHVTVARKVPADGARALEWPRPLANAFGIRCGKFVLMRSDRGAAGSIYSVVDEWLLDA